MRVDLNSLPKINMLSGMSWKDQDEYISSAIKGRYRNDFRREILKQSDAFEVVTKAAVALGNRPPLWPL